MFSFLFLTITATAYAQDEADKTLFSDTEKAIKSIFGNKEIKQMDYLYGFDEEADNFS